MPSMDTDESMAKNDKNDADGTSEEKVADEDYNALLQAELERYKLDNAAMQQEFNSLDEDTSPGAVKKAIIVAAPRAIQEVILLSEHGDSEGIRLNASKYIIDIALGKVKTEASTDGFESLIGDLMKEKEAKDSKKKTKKDTDTPGLL